GTAVLDSASTEIDFAFIGTNSSSGSDLPPDGTASVDEVVSPGAEVGCAVELPSVTQIWSTKSTPFAFFRAKVCVPEPERCSVAERSEEHTSELQSRGHLVCRLL